MSKSDQIDNGYKDDSKPMKRFYLNRVKDETGISRTGRVLEGVLTQSGKVITEWRPPMSTIGVYNSMQEFLTIHVDCHPSCNEVVWVEPEDFHCFGCGASGNTGFFCSRCGSGRRDYLDRDAKHCRKCGVDDIGEFQNFCHQCGVENPLSADYAFAIQDVMARKGLSEQEVVALINGG
jgi:hypothetical protein